MILLTSQKNELYDIIEGEGLSPSQFEFQEITSKFNLENKATQLVFKNSAWYYLFDTGFGQVNDVLYADYSPGETTITVKKYIVSWNEHINHFFEWIDNLKREITTEDKWERLRNEVENVNISYENDPNRFTVYEYEVLHTQMGVLKERISELGLLPKQVILINNKLDHLTEMSKNLTKTDWKSLFIGTIISIIIQLSLSQEMGQQLWSIIRVVFSKYFLTN